MWQDSKIDYLKNEQMEWNDFLHADTDSQKLKADQKFAGLAWSEMGDRKLTVSQKRNRWNRLIFCMLVQI